MKIIMHGKYYNKKNCIITCDDCGCQFQWELTDTFAERAADYNAYYGQRKFDYIYVTCPECGYKQLVCKKLVKK